MLDVHITRLLLTPDFMGDLESEENETEKKSDEAETPWGTKMTRT